MVEYRFYPEGEVPHVSTAEFHAGRERAPHLEQEIHQDRLGAAASLVMKAVVKHEHEQDLSSENYRPAVVIDLGCGDGGLMSLINRRYGNGDVGALMWGYDFQPSNQAGWEERGVEGYLLDAFGADRSDVSFGHIAIATEVLEHLADPHEVVRWIGQNSRFLVASSPNGETPDSHDECHTHGWDQEGYAALLEQGGYTVLEHIVVGQFQVILGERK